MSEKYNKKPEKISKIEQAKLDAKKVLAAAALFLTVVYGLGNTEGGSKDITKNNPDVKPTTVESSTIEKGAKLRYDPGVENGQNNNLIVETKEPIEIGAGTVLVLDNDGADGEWLGYPKENIEKADPNLYGKINNKINKDKDGIIWVNEQKASVKIDPQIANYYADRQIERPDSDSTIK